MIYENITNNAQWIGFLNISYSVFLAILFCFSFLRTWFSGKKIGKKYCSIISIHSERNALGKRIFFASVVSELLTYVFFCVIFEIKYADYPTNPIINGLSIIVWDYHNRFEGIVKLLIGMLIWVVLNVMFHVILLSTLKENVKIKDRVKIGLTASAKNIPFFFVYQVCLVFCMWLRTNELHVLQQYASGEM